jgi:hypothetical protein
MSTATAFSAIEEVLLKTVADTIPELRTCATDSASRAFASMGIIALGITTHHSLALLITASTLSRSALQAIATALSVWCSLVGRTVP